MEGIALSRQERRGKWLVPGIACFTLLFSVAMLGFVATSPDLRLRFLLSDEQADRNTGDGIQIRATPGLVCKGMPPEPGDILYRIGDTPIHTFLDFAKSLNELRNAPIPPGGRLHENSDPSELGEGLPTLVDIGLGQKWVEIEFSQTGSANRQRSWLLVQSLPLGEVVEVVFGLLAGVLIRLICCVDFFRASGSLLELLRIYAAAFFVV